MPRKRNLKLNLIDKQKALITKRLMIISLKVDEYVYNYKLISTPDAEAYIQEVTGYQDKCTDDKRSLQVIEKLLRCLKGIIEEQNELQALNGNVTLVEDIQMEEDITPLTQQIEAIGAVLNKTATNKTAAALNDVLLTQHVNVLQNKPLDLSVNSRKGTQVKHNNEDIDVLHRAISELSIQENDPMSVEKNNVEAYSQSVLSEFNCNDNMKSYKHKESLGDFQMEFDNCVQNTKETELEKSKPMEQPSKVCAAKSKDSIVDRIKSSEIVKNKRNTRKRKLLNVVSLANNIADVRTIEFTADTQQEMLANAVKKKTQRKPRKITRQLNKDSGEVKKQRQKKTKLAKDNKDKELRNMTQDTTNVHCINKNTCQQKFDEADVSPENILQNFETKVTDSKTQNEFSEIHLAPDSNVNLYDHQNILTENPNMNRQVLGNDLSWIENIRYVRDIIPEENMPSFYDDDFWNNYALPNDLTDSEFL